VTTPFRGQFFVPRLGIAVVNLHTIFEVSMFTNIGRYESQRKMWYLGWFRGLGVTQGHQQCHHLVERIQHPIRL